MLRKPFRVESMMRDLEQIGLSFPDIGRIATVVEHHFAGTAACMTDSTTIEDVLREEGFTGAIPDELMNDILAEVEENLLPTQWSISPIVVRILNEYKGEVSVRVKPHMTCPECGAAFPKHADTCYHFDCDEDDFVVHGCGISNHMQIIVSDPKHSYSSHAHLFSASVVEVRDDGLVVRDQDDEIFGIDFDEIEGYDHE